MADCTQDQRADWGPEMTSITFKCPGCDDIHSVPGDRWTVTGTSPSDVTCSPSLLATSGHYCSDKQDSGCWCEFNKANPSEAVFGCYRCHSFIRNGRIEFLSDCSHKLAGKTVPVPPDAKVTVK